MCISAEVSLCAFIFVVVFSLFNCWYFDWNPTVVALSLILCFIGLMQLVEFFAWQLQDTDDPEIRTKNNQVSRLGAIVLYFQPIAIFFVLAYFSSKIAESKGGSDAYTVSENAKYLSIALIMIYVISIIPHLINLPDQNMVMEAGCNSRMVHPWTGSDDFSGFLYIPVIVIIVLLLLKPTKLAAVFIGVFIGILLLSMLLTRTPGLSNNEAGVPSVWCLLAVIAPIIIFIGFKYGLMGMNEKKVTNN